jgi:hypothetical protein
LEEAIHRHRNFLRIPSTNDFNRSEVTGALASLIRVRSSHFGITGEGLPEARSPHSEVTSFRHLVASLRTRSTIGKTNWCAVPEERLKHLQALETVDCITDIAEIEDAIKYCRLLLELTPPSDSTTCVPALALGKALFRAFESTHNIEYLNESITVFRNNLGLPSTKSARFSVMGWLNDALSVRHNLSGDEKDFDERMQLCSMASKDMYTNLLARLTVSYLWTQDARYTGHHTTSTAYETALSLVEDTLLFAPTLETQHFHLVSKRGVYERLPNNMASYEVSLGRLPDAIEALERGRALIWSEMRGFRTSIDQLALTPHLAEEFTAVNRELEALTTSVSSDIVMRDDNGHDDGEGMDKFGRLVLRHRGLLTKRKELVSHVQALPGLEGFLKKPSFDDLRSAAMRGPVIVLNHSKWRCDILIVLHENPPSLITTPDDFYDRAIELRNRLVHTRNEYPLESRQYQRALQFVLRSLYESV